MTVTVIRSPTKIMNPTLLSLLKISGITVSAAFLSALSTMTMMPTTLVEWKQAIMPAVWAAFIAERVLLQQTLAKQVVATDAAPSAIIPHGPVTK